MPSLPWPESPRTSAGRLLPSSSSSRPSAVSTCPLVGCLPALACMSSTSRKLDTRKVGSTRLGRMGLVGLQPI